MKIAIVHEWLASYAGSERVVEQLLHLYPQADLFSLVDFLPPELRRVIQDKPVHTSFLQRLPLARRHFRQYLPLMPLAIEQFDLHAYDLVISSNHAVAKGVLTRPHQLHISYVHTPIRYAWDLQHQYLQATGLNRGLKALVVSPLLHYLRLWDVATAHRVDQFVANSQFVARRIAKIYRRPATVIYPPVAVANFNPEQPRHDFYLCVSRLVPYKRVDLVVAAFTQLGLPLVVIGDGPEAAKIKAMAGANICFMGFQPDAVVKQYLEACQAFIYAAEEDFGITLVEAQAAGAPVIAYRQGGASETVISGQTGILFAEQTVDSLMAAVHQFMATPPAQSPSQLHAHAQQFSQDCFRQNFAALVSASLDASPLEATPVPYAT
jgi:glycosyltransferase involved in cell wall biosynthesis